MATVTPLFPDGGLTDSQTPPVPLDPTVPHGKTLTNPNHMVTLVLSTNEQVQVGTVEELHRLITAMRMQQIWYCMPTEDVIIMLADACKLIICEAKFQNQKLLNTAAPAYVQGQLCWMLRGSAALLSTDEALQHVGHYRKSATPYASNADLLVPTGTFSPRMLVVDYRYTSAGGAGTTFADNPPLYFTENGSKIY
jgi:hypothetical protein